MTVNEDHFALVIGVDDYPNYRSLNGAKRDAQDFRDWLIDRETGGGLKDEHVWLVLSDDDPARPIHKHIDDALEKLLDAAATDAARLYIYFSGHGLSRSKTQPICVWPSGPADVTALPWTQQITSKCSAILAGSQRL